VATTGRGAGQTTITRNLGALGSEALIGGTLGTTGDLDVRDLRVQLPGSPGAAIATLGTVFDDLFLGIPANTSTGVVLTTSGAALTSSTVASALNTSSFGTCVKLSLGP